MKQKKLKILIIFLTFYLLSLNFSIAAEWSDPVKLVGLSGDEMFPSISPDGNQLAFVEYLYDNDKTVFDGIWLMDLKTNEQKIILTSDELLEVCSSSGVTEFYSMEVWRLSWNPNGKEILFSAYCRISGGDKVVRFGSISTVTITFKDLSAGEHPSWSPDGSKIVYLYKHGPTVAGCQRCGKELWVMNKDGSDAHMIYNVYGNNSLSAVEDCKILVNDTILWPSFSPDGKKILFVINHAAENSSINLINADGSAFKQLIIGSDFNNPQFTSDGKEIIFLKTINNQTTVWSMSSDGTNPKLLSSSKELKLNGLSVSPDGKKIFFPMASDGSGFDIWMMSREPSGTEFPEKTKYLLYKIIVLIATVAIIAFFVYQIKKTR
jgi:Tol biopolymer transport system component